MAKALQSVVKNQEKGQQKLNKTKSDIKSIRYHSEKQTKARKHHTLIGSDGAQTKLEFKTSVKELFRWDFKDWIESAVTNM